MIFGLKDRDISTNEDIVKFIKDAGAIKKVGLLVKARDERSEKYLKEHKDIIQYVCQKGNGLPLIYLTQGWIIECIKMLAKNDYHNDTVNKIIGGEKTGAFCLTEAKGGSSFENINTKMIKNENGYSVVGEKVFITNAKYADYYIIVGLEESEKKRKQLCFFLLPSDYPGISIEESFDFVGCQSAGISRIKFNCHNVDEKYLLSNRGGLISLTKCLQYERVDIALFSSSCIEYSLDVVKNIIRKEKLENSHVQNVLGRSYAEFQILNTYIDHVTQKMISGKKCLKESTIAKVYSVETGIKVISDLMKLLGAKGFQINNKLIQMYNELLPLQVGGGANDAIINSIY